MWAIWMNPAIFYQRTHNQMPLSTGATTEPSPQVVTVCGNQATKTSILLHLDETARFSTSLFQIKLSRLTGWCCKNCFCRESVDDQRDCMYPLVSTQSLWQAWGCPGSPHATFQWAPRFSSVNRSPALGWLAIVWVRIYGLVKGSGTGLGGVGGVRVAMSRRIWYFLLL